MGTVVKVLEITSGQEYALKYCNETDDGSIRRFGREVRIMQATVHPNVVEVIDSNVNYQPPYFTMSLALYSLEKIIPKIKDKFNSVLPIFEEICKGITAMHASGHYHRDIKPQNVLIMQNGQIVVSDFGLAKMEVPDCSIHSSSNGGFLGTPHYHAPEQIDGKPVDVRTDVFQLGKTFYQLYTGDHPHLINPAKLNASLTYILQTATNPNPDSRYQTVGALLQAMKTYEKSLDPDSNPAAAFENRLNEVKNLLGRNQTDTIANTGLLDALLLTKEEHKIYLEYFDKIPLPVIRVLASQMVDVFEPVLDIYTKNLNQFFDDGFYDFAYAEQVSNLMSTVFNSASKIEVKIKALRNILVAAVRCGRYYAMDTFDALIKNVKTDAEAMAVADLLTREMDWYSTLFDRIPRNKLHYIIQPVWTAAETLVNNSKTKEEEERQKMIDFFDSQTNL